MTLRLNSLFASALLVCSCVPLSSAQGQTKTQNQIRPNLAGVWSVDQTRETKNGFPEPSEMTLIISQQEPEIRMRRKFSLGGTQHDQELVYYTDQRGEANVTLRAGKDKSDSRTRWEGDRLVTRYDSYSSQIAGSPGYAEGLGKERMPNQSARAGQCEISRRAMAFWRVAWHGSRIAEQIGLGRPDARAWPRNG